MEKLKVNVKIIEEYCHNHGLSIPALARKMDVDRSYLYKILKKQENPGSKFIVGALRALPYDFNELFTLKEERETGKDEGSLRSSGYNLPHQSG